MDASNDFRLIKHSPLICWASAVLSKSGYVNIILAVLPLAGVAMAVLATMNLAVLGCQVGISAMCIEAVLAAGFTIAGGLSVVRNIEDSLASNRGPAPHKKGDRGMMTARNIQDARIDGLRKKIKLVIGFVLVVNPLIFALMLIDTATPYGRGSPILFFGLPLDLAPTVWFEINLLLHSRKSLPSRVVAPMKSGWRSFALTSYKSLGASLSALPDTGMGDTKRVITSVSGRQSGKRGVVLPTESRLVRAAVRSADETGLNP